METIEDDSSSNDHDNKQEQNKHSLCTCGDTEDVTAKIIGNIGRWQLRISILMSLLKLSNGWYQMNIIFMAPGQDFWCVKPKALNHYTEDYWRKICAPKLEPFPCLIYDPEILAMAPDIDRSLVPLRPCKAFVYDTSVFTRTMTADWDLVCDRHWLVHVTQCIMMAGVLFGGIFFGALADRYGRKYPLVLAIIIQSCCSFLASVLPTYSSFLVNWFILSLASGGITIIAFVLCMESVSGKWRMIIPILHQIPFGLGTSVLASLAYWIRDWRKLEFALATLSSLYIFYWFVIPESPRWLIANGQTEKAVAVLKKAANENKRNLTSRQIRRMFPKDLPEKQYPPGFIDFLSLPNMRLKTILLSINWFCTGIAFYTFSQYLGEIASNVFLTVALTGLISTLGPIVCVFVISRFGRRSTIWIFQFLTGICFLALLALPRNSSELPRLVFAGIGFAGLAASVPTLYLYSGELYPTLGRNIGLGGVLTFARVGSMIAPFIVSLNWIVIDFPLMILAATSFGQMILLWPLPETKNKPLPDTLEEAENY